MKRSGDRPSPWGVPVMLSRYFSMLLVIWIRSLVVDRWRRTRRSSSLSRRASGRMMLISLVLSIVPKALEQSIPMRKSCSW